MENGALTLAEWTQRMLELANERDNAKARVKALALLKDCERRVWIQARNEAASLNDDYQEAVNAYCTIRKA